MATSDRHSSQKSTGKAVNQLPKSVVREIRTPRSVGAGGGRPRPATRWARRDPRPYRDHRAPSLSEASCRTIPFAVPLKFVCLCVDKATRKGVLGTGDLVQRI